MQTGNITSAFGFAAKVLSASYTVEFQTHGVIGPSAAVAQVGSDSAVVLTNTQGVHRLRGTLSSLLGMPEAKIRVQYVEGSSAFGHCTSDDAAQAAALTSQLSGGKPVRLQFMRWDDHGFDCYGPGQLDDIRAGIDANGRITALDYTSWVQPLTNSNNAFETTYEMAGFGPISTGTGSANTAIVGSSHYTIANRRITTKSIPFGSGALLKTAQLRAPGDVEATFAFEQMIDELAHAANMDPVAFRLAQMNDDRWISNLNQTASVAKWETGVAASNLSSADVVTGRGVALAPRSGSLSAVIADIQVTKSTGKILVKHMYASQDAGLSIYVGGSENQMIGGVTQSVSRALYEAITFNKTRVTSLDWATYPLLRFKDHPAVTPILIQRPEIVPGGGGEPPAVPTPAAIANAFFDATGVRIRQMPMTPARVRAVLKAAAE
jgi:CO/xanthine dehydrogenase Mo-binding subunit